MTRALTYVEFDAPAWTQTSPDSPETEFTFRFAVDTDYLPNSIPAIPSITDISIEPATISLGQDLGQRGTVTVTFRDHRHVFNGEAFESGTFWGKFRARYGLTLQGNPFRLIRGTLGQALEDMETRHYIVESTEGPAADGSYQIVAKDIFTFIRGDRAQAPVISNGRLQSALTSGSLTMTLDPGGIASEYPTIPGTSPAFGYAAIGGSEIVAYSPVVGDQFGIVRGLFNTTAVAHSAGDRVQLILFYDDMDVADIIYDLLVTYGGVDPDFISLMDWQAETAAYLGTTYTGVITEPRPIDQLIAELIEQAALAMWWDDISQNIRLEVLKPLASSTTTFDEDVTLAGTLEVREQPEKRISHVTVYFGKFNPLVNDDQLSNYSASINIGDETAVTEYGGAVIKEIFSRWIPFDDRDTAELLANKQLARYRDPPRAVTFHLMRDQPTDPQLGAGYLLGGWPFQTATGDPDVIEIQVTRLNPRADRFELEAEEMLWTPFGDDIAATERTITYTSLQFDVNLRNDHDAIYPDVVTQSGDIINVVVQTIATLASSSTSIPALDIGSWPAGVTINLTVNGLIVGHGGNGGAGGSAYLGPPSVTDGLPGDNGGTALQTGYAINLTSTNGHIWGGGGGGGGNGVSSVGGAGGGGGAGYFPGDGGIAGTHPLSGAGEDGSVGSISAGGSPNGGNPGQNGTAGTSGTSNGGAGGLAGNAIDGDSFVTDIGAPGDIQGPQIN